MLSLQSSLFKFVMSVLHYEMFYKREGGQEANKMKKNKGKEVIEKEEDEGSK